MKPFIRLIGSPPGSGKTEARERLSRVLRKRTGRTFVVLEHEDSFTPEQRVKGSQTSGLQLSSKEFVMGYNLPGQVGFQRLLRTIASQAVPVVGFGPFENVTTEVGGKPLYEKMRDDDFGEFDFGLIYFLVSGDQYDVEEEIQHRLIGRAGKSEYQPILDFDKVGNPDYYKKRSALVRASAEKFKLPLIEYPINENVDWLVEKLADEILAGFHLLTA